MIDPPGNDEPVLSMTGPAINYIENDPATALDPTATVVDVDSDKFSGGQMTVSFSSGGTVNDMLTIIEDPLLVLDNGAIKVNNNVVGFFSGGTGGTDLVIDWNNATPADVQVVLQNIGYHNTSDDPDTTPRTIDFVTSDGDGGTSNIVQQTVYMTSVPDAPTAVNVSPGSVPENTDTSSGYSVGTLSSTDPDSVAPFTYTIVGGADAALFNIGGAGLDELFLTDGIPDHEVRSGYEVIIQSTDDTGLSFEQTLTISVTDVNEFDPVAIDATFNIDENSANGTFVGTVEASDADTSQTLSYEITAGNASGAFVIDAATGEIRVDDGTQLDFETTSQYVLTILVTDSVAPTRSDTATITINLNDINDAPTVANAIPDQVATEDVFFSFAFAAGTFNDADGDTLTYTSDASGWLSFDAATRTFSGTPLNTDVGTTTVTITADDGNGGTVSETFDIAVSNSNDAPTVANPVPDQLATEDTPFSFQFASNTFDDIDIGDTGNGCQFCGETISLLTEFSVAAGSVKLDDDVLAAE
jgi:hypothetical protein